jgi:hypothetical protein
MISDIDDRGRGRIKLRLDLCICVYLAMYANVSICIVCIDYGYMADMYLKMEGPTPPAPSPVLRHKPWFWKH